MRGAVKLWLDRLGPGLYGLACSGGADSMALADAAIAALGPSNVVLIHIDHGLSERSASVADEVAAWAREQGVPAVVRRVDVRGARREGSLEAAARAARYEAFAQIRDEVGLSYIFLAHTARDQAETVLMRVLRGTGPAGLAGIPAIRDAYVRPLIELPRATIEAYVAARGLPTWIDPMNSDPAFARVRMRERILPALRAENPALDDALLRLASSAAEWLDLIDDLCEPFARFPIDCAALRDQHPAVRKRALALALERAGLGYDATHLDALDDLATSPAAGERAIDLPGGQLVRSYDALEIRRGPSLPVADAEVEPLSNDAYEVRVWRAGDRMKPARLKGRSRKLSDLFIDAKIPRPLRAVARVVIRKADEAIIWAEHLGIAHDTYPNDSEFLRTISFASRHKGPMLSNGRG
ncbi:MAG TPA: tRNA lysidine(34) synthetase TilS [Kofleriaceae bacterium]|nr:tRNA lysidine(34) synthetase TilS [Kofleriaceae bacterium]